MESRLSLSRRRWFACPTRVSPLEHSVGALDLTARRARLSVRFAHSTSISYRESRRPLSLELIGRALSMGEWEELPDSVEVIGTGNKFGEIRSFVGSLTESSPSAEPEESCDSAPFATTLLFLLWFFRFLWLIVMTDIDGLSFSLSRLFVASLSQSSL